MRILLLTPFLPDGAAVHGGGVYLAALAASLAREADVGLVALTQPEELARLTPPPPMWQWLGTAPYPRRPAGRGRRRHRLKMLWHWRNQPLVAAKHWQPALPTVLQRALAEFRPDVALVELAQMAQYLPWLRGVPTILTDHEAGCPANTHTGLGAWGDRRDRRLWRHYVERFYPLATRLQAVTPEDAEILAGLTGREVHVRPPTYDVPALPVAPERAPARALFLGDYCHGPNPEAARILVRDVLPRLRAADPAAELWLAGPHPERLGDLAGSPGVRVLGFVPDLRALFGQVRLLLAPLFSGGGFRMKSLAALAHGLPVVTNALGARGCAVPAPARQVVEGAESLALATLTWLRSPAEAADAGRAAHAWAQSHLAGHAVASAQLAAARALLP
jgi:glycosyltransferase involved in cell wall biosynthesis